MMLVENRLADDLLTTLRTNSILASNYSFTAVWFLFGHDANITPEQ